MRATVTIFMGYLEHFKERPGNRKAGSADTGTALGERKRQVTKRYNQVFV
jgi:hypothetical protein